MTRKEFEALAKKAGLAKHGLGWTAWESQLERFAALVRAEDTALLRQALYVIEAWERGCDESDYWRDRDDAIAALRERLGETK